MTNKWYAAKRDDYDKLWNNISSDKVLSSESSDTLRTIIRKTGGRPDLIKKLLNND